MLAYVFSHRPAKGVGVAAYEESLRRFHRLLAEARPRGLLDSATYRVAGAYEDWYRIESSAALEVLNDAAVRGRQGHAHDDAARMTADGSGKLYSLAAGALSSDAGFEVRFSKPAGTSYPDLYARLRQWTELPGVSLWRRMMVLGPPPEFCLIASSAPQFPAETRPEVLRRELI